MPLASEGTARQVIRRPAVHRPGGPPPWGHLAPAARHGLDLARVTARLAAYRPAAGLDTAEVAVVRGINGSDVDGTRAAVLVPLFEEAAETRVVLTVRAAHLRSHRAEVAFPGGRLDAEEGIEDAARREASEEVGLDPASVRVVRHLTSLPTVGSNTVMTPVVATLPARPTLVPQPTEVERVFDLALADLLADGVFAEEWWAVPGRPGLDGRPGGEYPVWFFEAAGEIIWGATARVLVELLAVALDVAPPVGRPGAGRYEIP
ncbi:MAG: CoA pyrophosphatase [Actinomycetota bacterium]|nr:CoA pyrophosphatase [Actinomycetota bacterium]